METISANGNYKLSHSPDMPPEEVSRQLEEMRPNALQVIGEVVALERRGNRWVGLCPFHSETTPSFTVNDDGLWYCFGCSAGGDIVDFQTMARQHNDRLMAGYNLALDDLSNWAKAKYVATGDEAWLNLAVEFFQDVGTAKMQEAKELMEAMDKALLRAGGDEDAPLMSVVDSALEDML